MPDALELIPALTPGGEGDAVLPVRWCIPPSLIAELAQNKVRNAYVFLLVRYVNGDEQRWLVPVEREMAYVQFNRAGTHELHGVVVYGKDRGRLRDQLLMRQSPDAYSYPAFHQGHFIFGYMMTGVQSVGDESSVQVIVPDKFFAKPFKPLHAYANLPFKAFGKPVDQCKFRQRLCFTTALTVFLAGIVGGLVLLLRLIAPGLFHGLDVAAHWAGGVFVTIGHWFGANWITIGQVVGFVALCLVAFVVIAVGATSGTVQDRLRSWKGEWFDRMAKAKAERRERERLAWLEEVEEIACSGIVKHADLGELAFKRRSVSLRFRAVKAKVCRPYARG